MIPFSIFAEDISSEYSKGIYGALLPYISYSIHLCSSWVSLEVPYLYFSDFDMIDKTTLKDVNI